MGEARRRLTNNISAERQQRLASVSESVDAVTEADRRFFLRFPARSYRMRIASRSELVQMCAIGDVADFPARPCMEWATVVRQLQPGARIRLHVQVPKGADLDGASEDQCREIYEAVRGHGTEAARIEANAEWAFREAFK